MKPTQLFFCMALAFSFTQPAGAVILADAYYTPDFNIDKNTKLPIYIPIRGTSSNNSQNILFFNVPVKGKVKITFTAECYVTYSAVGISIVIDNDIKNPVLPTDASKLDFCQNGSYKTYRALITRPSITVVKTLPSGRHSVRVLANANLNAFFGGNGGTVGLSQSTILVEQ